MSLPSIPFEMLIVGKSKSGKSHLTKYIIAYYLSQSSYYENFNSVIVFTKTKFNQNYDFIDSKWIYTRFDPNSIKPNFF